MEVTYGASGSFFAQLKNGAPFDLFLSADKEYPLRLVEVGLAAREDVFPYAVGRLVVWVPKESALDVEKQGAKVLLDPAVKKVSVANPRVAPYGRAAVAALKSLGVYDRVEGKLVYGENVAQAAQFVQSNAADVGVFALSLARSPAMHDRGRFWEVPADAIPPLEQSGVILSAAAEREAAERFRAYLMGPDGKAVLRRFGFSPPEE